ncbi:MAG: divergent polysaccharide deacetylase family protein [Rhodospirillales bacterium]|nr:divergent polysaccharide deacetylase family protein [Rhodospirillales bacterium]
MKLPFTIKLGAVKGVFARLNPLGLLRKIKSKLPSKLGGKGKAGKEADDGGHLDDEDMFGDLGDLSELDAAAKERQREAAQKGDDDDDDDDEAVDYTSDAYTTDKEVNLDRMTSGNDAAAAQESKLADHDDDGDDNPLGDIDLANLQAMPDFDDDTEAEDEDGKVKSKKKKLLLIVGGGVTVAVMIGAASWLFLSGTMSSEEAGGQNPAVVHDAVVSLDNVPLVSQGLLDSAPVNPDRDPSQQSVAAPAPGSAAAPKQGGGAPEPTRPMSEADAALAQLGLNVSPEPGAGVVVPSVTRTSFKGLSAAPAGTPLAVAPVGGVAESTDLGVLPKIAEDGLTPYEAYARPEPAMDAAKPKIAIIITGVGMSRAATEATLAAMPQDVALALDVYARGLDFWVARAREDGHEILLSLPMESETFPFSDPGPEALKVLNAPEENIKKLEFIFTRTTGYFGVLTELGGKFLAVEDQVNVLMEQLKKRGLMYVDGGAPGSLGTRVAHKQDIPWAAVEMNLDQAQSRAELERLLQDLSDLAQKRAIAVARVSATPLTLAVLSAWIATLDQKGMQLVPLSALAKKQIIR